MTNKQMSDQVIGILGLQDIVALDETGFVNDSIYRGTIDLLARTKCVVRCVQLRTEVGVDTYTLDHSLLGLFEIENGTRPRARRDQVDYQPSYTMIRGDLLRLEPAPDVDGQTVQVWAVLRPQPMAAPTDSVGMEQFGAIPDEYQDAIVTYALWKAADYGDDVSSQQGERYRTLYEGPDGRGGRIQQIKVAVNRRGTNRLGPRRVNLTPIPAHDAWVG